MKDILLNKVFGVPNPSGMPHASKKKIHTQKHNKTQQQTSMDGPTPHEHSSVEHAFSEHRHTETNQHLTPINNTPPSLPPPPVVVAKKKVFSYTTRRKKKSWQRSVSGTERTV